MRKIVFLVLSMCHAVALMADCLCKSVNLHSKHNEKYVVSFGTPILDDEVVGVFRDSFLAIKVLSVVVDGVDIVPEVNQSNLVNFDSILIDVGGGSFSYKIDLRGLMFMDSVSLRGGIFAAFYDIPKEFNEIIIRYKIRYPGGGLSEECLLVSYETYEKDLYSAEFEGGNWELLGIAPDEEKQ